MRKKTYLNGLIAAQRVASDEGAACRTSGDDKGMYAANRVWVGIEAIIRREAARSAPQKSQPRSPKKKR